MVMVLFLWAKQLVFNRLPSLRQLTSTDADAGCVKTSFASKQLVFVFHLNFPRMVPFCRRWLQLSWPPGKHVSHHSLTQIHFLSPSSMGLIVRAAKEDEKGDAGDSVVIWVGECFFRSARQQQSSGSVLVAPLLVQ